MSAAAEFPAFPGTDARALVRWPACLALVLALHAAAVLALLRRADTVEPFAPAPEAITIDLAPVPEAPPAAEEAPAAEPEPEPVETPPPPPEPVAEAHPEPPPPEQVAELPPEPPPPEPPPPEPPPPEPPPVAAPAVVLPQPPPPPPPPPRPVARPQTQPRPATEDRRAAVADARQTAEAAPAPAVAQPPPPNAVPTWHGQLLGRLQRFKQYPEAARSRREEGVVHLTFSMDREGRVLAANVAKGSGFPELDAETLALVRRAEPLPPPPLEMQGNPLTLTVPVRFSLR